MIAAISAMLQLGAAVAHGLVSAADAAGAITADGSPAFVLLLVGALGAVAIALVARHRPLPVEPDPGAAVHRGQTVDRSRLLAQSDPDARGRTRPRAPTSVAAA